MLPKQKEIKLIELFKVCNNCGILKLWTDFHKRKDFRFGIYTICKLCKSVFDKNYYKANKKRLKLYQKGYRKNNKEKVSAVLSAWQKNNPKYNHYQKIYARKLSKNPKFKLNHNIRSAIGKSLKGNKNGKRWETLVGYTLQKLKKHLEKQFTGGMTWENYGRGGWVVDHKIPISVFNFAESKHRDFRRCWALKNLQPMWARENVIKSNKLNNHFQPSLGF